MFFNSMHMLLDKIKQFKLSLGWLKKQIKHPGRRLQEQTQKLDDLEIKMRREFHFYLTQSKNNVKQLTLSLIQNSPYALIREQQQNNHYLSINIHKATLKSLQNTRFKLADLSRALNNLSPLNILSRGYSMTYGIKDNLLTNAQSIKTGDQLRTRFHRDEVISSVIQVHKTANKNLK